jgi:hypothetical protein
MANMGSFQYIHRMNFRDRPAIHRNVRQKVNRSLPDFISLIFDESAGYRLRALSFQKVSFGCMKNVDCDKSGLWQTLCSPWLHLFTLCTEENPPATAGGTDTSSPLHSLPLQQTSLSF